MERYQYADLRRNLRPVGSIVHLWTGARGGRRGRAPEQDDDVKSGSPSHPHRWGRCLGIFPAFGCGDWKESASAGWRGISG